MTIYEQHPTQLTFRIDMNSLREDRIGTLLAHATDPGHAFRHPPHIGDDVWVEDEDGTVYQAHVVERHDMWLGLTITWESKTVLPPMSYGESSYADLHQSAPATGVMEPA